MEEDSVLYITFTIGPLTIDSLEAVTVPWVMEGVGWCSSGMLVWLQIRYVQKTIPKWRLQQRYCRWVFSANAEKKKQEERKKSWQFRLTIPYYISQNTIIRKKKDITKHFIPIRSIFLFFAAICVAFNYFTAKPTKKGILDISIPYLLKAANST